MSDGSDLTYLFYLRQLTDNPILNSDASRLRSSIESFIAWLEEECSIERVWLPSIDVETDIRVKRISALKMAGDTTKHTLTRLRVNVNRARRILE